MTLSTLAKFQYYLQKNIIINHLRTHKTYIIIKWTYNLQRFTINSIYWNFVPKITSIHSVKCMFEIYKASTQFTFSRKLFVHDCLQCKHDFNSALIWSQSQLRIYKSHHCSRSMTSIFHSKLKQKDFFIQLINIIAL